MQTENTQNEMNRIDDARRNDGSQIPGSGHDAGCNDCTGRMPHATQEEQRNTMDRVQKPPEATGEDTSHGQKKRPFAAIREAKRRALIWGFAIADVVSEDGLPCDFLAMKDGITSFIRVRRIADSWFDDKKIQERCRSEIAEFRAMKPQQGLIFELWVRGYARAFHRYRILPDTIGKIGMVLEPETVAGKKALDGERRSGTAGCGDDSRERMEGVLARQDPARPESESAVPGRYS